MSQQIFVKILCFSLIICTLTYVCFNLAEIWYTYWGTKGKYQYKIWDKSDQQLRSYKRFYE